ncbi:hypothetical protein BLNAU_16097 [Blattamonas nauphoetae]|uniref:Uncharacterized protein n=1 Tax=Blattamonas nauphoetae TaxID=2049346 RepID=A0ABQ9XAN2_9EUKA|nr:hypothetical protein BLNAU_16097 [Blattamonas nauphoetae]
MGPLTPSIRNHHSSSTQPQHSSRIVNFSKHTRKLTDNQVSSLFPQPMFLSSPRRNRWIELFRGVSGVFFLTIGKWNGCGQMKRKLRLWRVWRRAQSLKMN